MKLLYAFPEPFPLSKARAVQVLHTVLSLAEAGVQVDFAYVPVAGVDDPIAHYGYAKPGNLRLVPLSRALPGVLSALKIKSGRLFSWRLKAWIKAQREAGAPYDWLFVRHLKLAASVLAWQDRPRVLYEAHEVFAETAPPKKRAQLAALESRVLALADKVVSISGELAKRLKAVYGFQGEMAIIPSATTLPTATGVKSWDEAAKRIIYAGSLYPWKGVDDLVAAAQWLPGCEITVVGGDAEGITKLRQQLGRAGAVFHFKGNLSHSDTLKEIAQACIAVLPNRKGSVSAFTSPLKLFEYMAMGCAVVASDLPVFREVLQEGDTIWFEAGEPQSLANGIRKLLDNPALAQAMGERASILAKNFTWDKRAQTLCQQMACLDQSGRKS